MSPRCFAISNLKAHPLETVMRTSPSFLAFLVISAHAALAQSRPATNTVSSPGMPNPQQAPAARPVVMDSARARQLYVSNKPEDHPVANWERDMTGRVRAESIMTA